jgi:hypothetical protein
VGPIREIVRRREEIQGPNLTVRIRGLWVLLARKKGVATNQSAMKFVNFSIFTSDDFNCFARHAKYPVIQNPSILEARMLNGESEYGELEMLF